VQNDGLLPVTADHLMLVGVFDGFSWIRYEGKGSFVNSPAMKAYGDERIAAGEKRLVVDLGGCTGMDSTFMGTLAGMATRLSAIEGGGLQIADTGERNRRSLEDLGLDFLMEIDPPEAVWSGRLEVIRKDLNPPQANAQATAVMRNRHVLEAHQNLSGMSEKNASEFKDVIRLFQNDLAEKITRTGEGELA
jgi:anti-sigma B factor antagonist